MDRELWINNLRVENFPLTLVRANSRLEHNVQSSGFLRLGMRMELLARRCPQVGINVHADQRDKRHGILNLPHNIYRTENQ